MPSARNPVYSVGWVAASLGSTGTDLTVHGASGAIAMAGAQGRVLEPSQRTREIAEDCARLFTAGHRVGLVKSTLDRRAKRAPNAPQDSMDLGEALGRNFRRYFRRAFSLKGI